MPPKPAIPWLPKVLLSKFNFKVPGGSGDHVGRIGDLLPSNYSELSQYEDLEIEVQQRPMKVHGSSLYLLALVQ